MGWAIEGSFVMGIAALVVYLYYLRKGQFDRSEEVKYIVFREDEDA
jgi:hypothetical protein